MTIRKFEKVPGAVNFVFEADINRQREITRVKDNLWPLFQILNSPGKARERGLVSISGYS